MKTGDYFQDVVGPLGIPSHVEKFGRCVLLGGGVGIPPIYPIALALKEAGNTVETIIGARTKDLLIYQEELTEARKRWTIDASLVPSRSDPEGSVLLIRRFALA